jgi:hypothetical protein
LDGEEKKAKKRKKDDKERDRSRGRDRKRSRSRSLERDRRRARSRSDSSERPLVQQVQPPTTAIDHEFEEMKWALNMGLIGRQQGYLIPGLWIRIDLIRIRIQQFCSIRIRIKAKTELSKTISFSNFFEIKI